MPKTALKKLMYVPGLAMPELVVAQANSAQAFIAKVGRAFRGDAYMTERAATRARSTPRAAPRSRRTA